MSKYDTLFVKVLRNERFAKAIGPDVNRYNTIEEGKKAINKQIKAIAEIIGELGKKIEHTKSNGKHEGSVTSLDPSEYQSVYRKVLSILTK